jgi:hypothetical protein
MTVEVLISLKLRSKKNLIWPSSNIINPINIVEASNFPSGSETQSEKAIS